MPTVTVEQTPIPVSPLVDLLTRQAEEIAAGEADGLEHCLPWAREWLKLTETEKTQRCVEKLLRRAA